MKITRTDLQSIIDHCNAGYPNEACGILGGRHGRVERVYCMTNARPGPVSYEVEPEEQFQVMKDLRRAGLDMIGLFHSHPGGHAYPSSVDVEKAYWPGTTLPNYPEAVYVIVSLVDRSKPDVRGYAISEGAIREVPLTVLERRSSDLLFPACPDQEETFMSIKVRIPTPLQKFTNGKTEVECAARNITELVDALEKDYPGMKERLSEGGKIRRFINIYVNDEDIRFVNKEDTVLKDGDNISIVPAIAGG